MDVALLVALVHLQDVAIDVADRERHATALDAERLELQRGHRAGRVLDQHRVVAQREQLPVATLAVRVDELPGERP